MQKIIKYRILFEPDFVGEIEIKEDSTFTDLHNAIQEMCDYDPTLMTTFYTTDNLGEPDQEIIFECIDEKTQKDCLLMEDTFLNFQKPEVGQRLIYIFDFFSVRCFHIEIVGLRNYTKKDEKTEFPKIQIVNGKAPQQVFIDNLDPENDEEEDILEEEDPYYDDEFEDGYDDFDEFGGGGYDSDDIY